MNGQVNLGDKKAGAGNLLGSLLDFEAMPGRYPLALREPRVLFDHAYTVLQLAAGRQVESLSLDETMLPRARRAARYFVRTAMLRQGADYYTMMGLQPGFEEAALRDNYRLLIRLSHPDFATPGRAWPANAATRINLAKDVLGSSVKRHEYDLSLKNARSQLAAATFTPRPKDSGFQMRRPVQTPRSDGPGLGDRISDALAAAGAIGLALLRVAAAAVKALVRLMTRRRKAAPNAPRATARGHVALRLTVASCVVVAAGASVITAWLMMSRTLPGAANPGFVAEHGPELRRDMPQAGPAEATRVWEATEKVGDDAAVVFQGPQAPVPDGPVLRLTMAPDMGNTNASTGIPTGGTQRAWHAATVVPPGPFHLSTVSERAAEPPQVTIESSTRPSPQVVEAPASVAVSTVSVAATAPAPAMPEPTMTPVSMVPRVKLADVQPTLAFMVSALESGRGENVLPLVEASSRKTESVSNFVLAYNKMVSGAKSVQLGQVSLHSASADDQLVVDGIVQLFVQDQNNITLPRNFPVRAYFVSRGGNPVLTRLSTTDRQ